MPDVEKSIRYQALPANRSGTVDREGVGGGLLPLFLRGGADPAAAVSATIAPMHVLLDGEEIRIEKPTIAAALEAAKRAAEGRKRVVIEASMDGKPIADAWLECPPCEPRPGAEIRFVSADPLSLVRVTFLEIAEELKGAIGHQEAAAKAVQTGRLDEAMPRVSAALGVWQNVREGVINGATLLGMDLGTMPARTPGGGAEETVGQHIESLAKALGELKRAIGASDWPGVADVLAYDLGDQAKSWQVVMNALADEVGRRSYQGA